MLRKYFQINTWVILTIIILLDLIFNLIIKSYLFTDKVVYNSMAEQVTLEEINTVMTSLRSNGILFLLLATVNKVVEMLLIAVCITIGTLLLKYQVTFKQIWSVVVKSYIVFALSTLPLLIAILFFGIERFADLNFIPLFSLAELIGESSIPSWALYPLQLINIFQLGFVLMVVTGLNLVDQRGFVKWSLLVASTYGLGLLIIATLTSFVVSI